jgi:glycosyltransferase involved in cell wall biosynthesis
MRGEWDVMAVRSLVRLMRRLAIEIVHFHTAHAHTLGLLAAQRAGVPIRVLSRRVDFHIHRHPLNRWKYGPALTAVVAISDGIRKVLLEDGIAPERVITVRSGIDMERIRKVGDGSGLRDEFGISGDCLVVGMVAALAPHKDHRTFLEAAALVKKKISRIRFLLVGEGPLQADLLRLTKKLDLAREVIFTGFRDDVLEITGLVDVFVLSSYLEGMGTAVLDAMALGKPVVATEVGGIPEIVIDGETGLLVPSRSPNALADAVVQLAADPDLRRRMGVSGRSRARHFDVENVITQTEEIYSQQMSLHR